MKDVFGIKARKDDRRTQTITALKKRIEALPQGKLVAWDEFQKAYEAGVGQHYLHEAVAMETLGEKLVERLGQCEIKAYAPNGEVPLAFLENYSKKQTNAAYEEAHRWITYRRSPFPSPFRIVAAPAGLILRAADIAKAAEDVNLPWGTVQRQTRGFFAAGWTDLYTPLVAALEKAAAVEGATELALNGHMRTIWQDSRINTDLQRTARDGQLALKLEPHYK